MCQVCVSSLCVKFVCQVSVSSLRVKFVCQVSVSTLYVKFARQVCVTSLCVKFVWFVYQVCVSSLCARFVCQVCSHFRFTLLTPQNCTMNPAANGEALKIRKESDHVCQKKKEETDYCLSIPKKHQDNINYIMDKKGVRPADAWEEAEINWYRKMIRRRKESHTPKITKKSSPPGWAIKTNTRNWRPWDQKDRKAETRICKFRNSAQTGRRRSAQAMTGRKRIQTTTS